MGITSRLVDSHGRNIDSVESRRRRGTLVATMPAREMSFFDASFMAPDGSIEMAINASTTGGTTLNLWDGTGALDTGGGWTLTDDYGGSNETAAAMHAGTNGLDTGLARDGDKITLDNGTAISLSSYQTLSFWINPQSRQADSDIELRWRDAGDNSVGNKLRVNNYVTWSVGTWSLVQIPIADFAVTSNVRYLRIKFKNSDQRHYIDEIQLSTAGGNAVGPTVFRVQAPLSDEAHVNRVLLTMVASKTSWSHGDFGDIAGGIASGMVLRWWDKASGAVYANLIAKDNMDLFSRMSVVTDVSFFDTGQLITWSFDMGQFPMILQGPLVLDILALDDLSSLLRLQARAQGGYDKYLPDLDAEPYVLKER